MFCPLFLFEGDVLGICLDSRLGACKDMCLFRVMVCHNMSIVVGYRLSI